MLRCVDIVEIRPHPRLRQGFHIFLLCLLCFCLWGCQQNGDGQAGTPPGNSSPSIFTDTFAITIFFIAVATAIAAFVRRIKRDKCLKDYEGFVTTLESMDGSQDRGRLHVENTGLAFSYIEQSSNDSTKTSRLLYKAEYNSIYALVRYHDDLNEENRQKRQRDLDRTYHPDFIQRSKRKTINVFKTIRDSIGEVVTLLLSQVKKTPGAGKVLSGQDKYVNQMQQEALGVVGTSYEPLLEPYIGHRVLVELKGRDTNRELLGILKDYTAEFIEVMDVDYASSEDKPSRKADVIIPRSHGIVRHLAE